VLRQVRAPAFDAQAFAPSRGDRRAHRLEIHVDPERAKPGARQRQRVAAASHRDVERAQISACPEPRRGAALTRDPLDPFDDERGR
jgi:hypothetical protein